MWCIASHRGLGGVCEFAKAVVHVELVGESVVLVIVAAPLAYSEVEVAIVVKVAESERPHGHGRGGVVGGEWRRVVAREEAAAVVHVEAGRVGEVADDDVEVLRVPVSVGACVGERVHVPVWVRVWVRWRERCEAAAGESAGMHRERAVGPLK